MTWRAVIVDDEPDARGRLRRLLAECGHSVEVVGEAGDGVAAVEAIEAYAPDIAFMDVEMPGLDGFGVLDALDGDRWPVVVFTTAYRDHAIRAFEVHALDYLLKPIHRTRLSECLTRLEGSRPPGERVRLDNARREHGGIERLLVRSGQKRTVLDVDDVISFESEDKLVFARTAGSRFLLSISMRELEQRLDPARFCRVHKQAIVRFSLVREICAAHAGHYTVTLDDGSEVPVGRKYMREFRARFS